MGIRIKKATLLSAFLCVIIIASYAQNNDKKPVVLPDSLVLDTSYFVNFDDEYNLFLAVSESNAPAVQLLLNRKINPDIETFEGVTPLIFASEKGDMWIIELLISHDADVNKPAKDGMTPLLIAVKYNDVDLTEYLIRHGADVNKGDKDNRTPLYQSVTFGFEMVSDLLLYYDADPNMADKNGVTPLMVASTYGYKDLIELLHTAGASLDIHDKDGDSPIFYAVASGNPLIVKTLIDLGSEVQVANYKNLTPLTIAIKQQDTAMMRYLIDAGSNVNYKISFSQTPLNLAYETENEATVQLLKKAGARVSLYPVFDKTFIGIPLNFNSLDFMSGLDIGVLDGQKKLMIRGKALMRPFYQKVVVEEKSDIAYQYWERRYLLQGGLVKYFEISKQYAHTTNLYVGTSLGYTGGKYRGSALKPNKTFIFIPSVGALFLYKSGYIDLNLSYNNFNLEDRSPIFINVTFGMIFTRYHKYFNSFMK